MAGIVVCVLGADERLTIVDTIQSVQSFGLPVHVAVRSLRPLLRGLPGVFQHRIHWTGDFAKARNQLLEGVNADYVLWLDSDERLLSFPELDPGQLEDDFYAIRFQGDSSATPMQQVRIHRLAPAIRWHNPVHEQPWREARDIRSVHLLPGAVIVHRGYEIPSVVRGKIIRNRLCVRPNVELSDLSLGELLAVARHETEFGQFNFMSWIQVFRHPQVQPKGLGFDGRYEAAYMLCCAGYAGFARALLRANPLIIPLRLALLVHGCRQRKVWDESETGFLLQLLQNGFFDARYPFPRKLLGCDRHGLIDYLQNLSTEWQNGESMMPLSINAVDERRPYIREGTYLSELLDDDLVVMHPSTLKVVMLNPVAAVLWDALRWPMDLGQLVGLLREAFPLEDLTVLTESSRETLSLLQANGLIHPADSPVGE